ncbi:TetR family transcriptional regulator [Brevundimonas sp. Leaf363]|uniref:acyl-CoA-like ligand-binding transcription factor n=1 Tax=Brevundimonas sp. Leaf363 TaxID=1736353 RepID=UPI0006FF3A33|nr:TetR family transcriptional regulator [Brevundimonas sp. Leaf363]KQS54366.1 TetR family transcriptional regulator [Brevundimonas sp. Leaf363]
MQEVQNKHFESDGLRARKRSETHGRIQAEALRLFLVSGFDSVTLDDIAEAAEVSRRTLLNYFGSKEEIALSAKADFPQVIADAVAARPADESLLDMVENAMIDLARRPPSPEGLAVARLIHATPSLRAGDQAKYEAVERLLAQTLANQKGLPPDDVACRVVAGTAVSILKLATDHWLTHPGESPEIFGRQAFAALRRAAG